ncbi:MAG: HlyD family efflux transporter periplasmic adaptor subunit, partial [Nannocystaceae bacterium]
VGERARCLFHDAESATTWSTERDDGGDLPVGRGLVAQVARSAEARCLERAGDEARYAREVDDPEGDPRSRLLLQPVVEPAGAVHAVLVVARSARATAFDGVARERVAELARRLAPLLDQLALQVELDANEAVAEPEPLHDTGPYRAEALAAHARSRDRGEVVRLESPWIAWSYRLLVGLLVVGLAYVSLVRVGDYAGGPALVTIAGRTEITAVREGSVVEIMVRSGEAVQAGQPLARLHDVEDAAELRRLELELRAQMRSLLRDPADEAARQAVAGLRGQRERARMRQLEDVLTAPRAGVVQDLRARPGQAVQAGDVLLSIAEDELANELVALLPGDDRPRLREGAPLRLELDGYANSPLTLEIDEIDVDVISPAEALRQLGPAVGEGLALSGPVVMVRGRLPAEGFWSRGQRLRFHHGMRGTAEVRVRSTTILEALVPALEGR